MPNKAIDENALKDFLMNAGYKAEDLENLGKRQLKAEYDKVSSASQLLDTAIVTDTGKTDVTNLMETIDSFGFEPSVLKPDPVKEPEREDTTPAGPKPTDPEWTDFVMKHFKDNELDNGAPKADSLRRVAELLLGVFDIDTHVVQVPDLDGRATVVVRLRFHDTGRMVSGAADVSSVNTAKEFAVHAVATAETRAEGRALRKALRLNKVLTAEELQGADPDEANGLDSRAPTSMLNSLKLMCNKQKIDLDRLAKVKFDIDNIQDLTLSQGRSLSTQLFEYGRKPEEIPDEIKTF